jgi:uncharacterized protein YcaQ
MPAVSLSVPEARRLALRAQGLHGRDTRPRHPAGVLARTGALQLDTISVLARSHELVCFARCGPVGAAAVSAACWGTDATGKPRAVEYWAHAASILPLESWPWFAFRRRAMRGRREWYHDAPVAVLADVRRRLELEGPLTATELGGAKQGGPWWDWSPMKAAVERLLAWGEVVCTSRRGWKRVYDLADRALPAELVGPEPDDASCLAALVAASGRGLGVGTVADLADYFRLSQDQTRSALPHTPLVPIEVAGWAQPAWADPDALEGLDRRGRHRTTLLSPFDSLIWDRARTERLFGLPHRLEAYVPAAKRIHGYYAMPVLAGGRLVGRVDPGRAGRTLVAKRVGILVPSAVPDVAVALREAATWVGADDVALEVVEPADLRPSLVEALTAGGI